MRYKKALAFILILAFAFCGCSSQTTMDIEYLQEEAFQKGYEQGLADASAEEADRPEYDSGYNAGYEEGYAEGYSVGIAVSESSSGAEKPQNAEKESFEDDAVYDYVLNTNSKKFHNPDCSSVGDIKDKNKGYFSGARAEIIAEGFEPCGRCNP